MLHILIVDDHAIVREGLKQILAATPDLSVHGEASSAAEAIDTVQTGHWDAVVLDLSLPDRTARYPQPDGTAASVDPLHP
jgi:two-component system invasion response regulator UvrY